MWRTAILGLLVLSITLPTHAKPYKHQQQGISQEKNKNRLSERAGENAFSPAERNMIRAQLQQKERLKTQNKHKDLPPGLQKKVASGKALPPGWQKKITPGKSLDYQVYRQGKSLPEDILRRLPQPPIGSEILQIEDEIIRLDSATRTILDVFNLNPGP